MTLGVPCRATGGALHYLPGVVEGASGRLTPSARAAVMGAIGTALANAAANEAVLKVEAVLANRLFCPPPLPLHLVPSLKRGHAQGPKVGAAQ